MLMRALTEHTSSTWNQRVTGGGLASPGGNIQLVLFVIFASGH